MSNRNREAGHSWEREIVNNLKAIGYEFVVTSRAESRSKDANKIDICNKDEIVNGRLPFSIQAKSVTGTIPYAKFLGEIKKDGTIRIVMHRQTEKSKGSVGRFMVKGHYAFLEYSDMITFLTLHKQMEDLIIYLEKFSETLPESVRTKFLTKIKSFQ